MKRLLAVSSETSEDRWHRVAAPSLLLWAGKSISGTYLQCFVLSFWPGGGRGGCCWNGCTSTCTHTSMRPAPPPPLHVRHNADYAFVCSDFQNSKRANRMKFRKWLVTTHILKPLFETSRKTVTFSVKLDVDGWGNQWHRLVVAVENHQLYFWKLCTGRSGK